MKINFFDVVVYYLMRYKLIIFAFVVSIITIIATDFNALVFIPICFAVFLIDVLYNSLILFDYKSSRVGLIKKRMYKKYKDIIYFKAVLIYNEASKEYTYINQSDEQYFKCNIYLWVINTYKKEEFLSYEFQKKDFETMIFIGKSKMEVSEHFHQFLVGKVRKINKNIRDLKNVADNYSELERDIECHKYSS